MIGFRAPYLIALFLAILIMWAAFSARGPFSR